MLGNLCAPSRLALLLISILVGTSSFGFAQSDTSTTTGTSRAFNPAISLNGLFLGQLDSGRADMEAEHEEEESEDEHHHGHSSEGLGLQEVELRFTSDIDPYSKADATLAFHDDEVSFEEAYIISTALPWDLGLRAGRMYVPFSRENVLHTHQLPFVQRSLGQGALFEEGYSDVGVEVSALAPTPFFLEVRAAAFDGGDEFWFDAEGGEDLAWNGGIAALWDLNESTTFQIDAGGLVGQNGHGADTWSKIGSVSAALRWKPTRNTRERGFRLSAEYLSADRNAAEMEENVFLSGFTSAAQWQFARRWWMQARYDRLDPSELADDSQRSGVLLAFVPSEFQALRAEVSFVSTPEDDYTEFFLQYNFTIGSHPAHRY